MTEKSMPRPHPSAGREHPVARLDALLGLRSAVEMDASLLEPLKGAHVLSAGDFNAEIQRQLFRRASCYELSEMRGSCPAKGRILSNLFFDEVTDQTRLSFNSAWLRLGGTLLNFDRPMRLITQYRHAPDEVAELCNNFGDVAVVRTEQAALLNELLPLFRVPVCNAGNGTDEHPTHGLADLYTLFKWRPDLLRPETAGAPLRIGLFGNVTRTPTLRSFLLALSAFPHAVERVVLLSHVDAHPDLALYERLKAAGIRLELSTELGSHTDSSMALYRGLLPGMDMLYVHLEHHDEFSRLDFLEALQYFKSDALVLNPQILNQEFSDRLNDSNHNGYFAQARGAVFLRMALFSAVLGDTSEAAGVS